MIMKEDNSYNDIREYMLHMQEEIERLKEANDLKAEYMKKMKEKQTNE